MKLGWITEPFDKQLGRPLDGVYTKQIKIYKNCPTIRKFPKMFLLLLF